MGNAPDISESPGPEGGSSAFHIDGGTLHVSSSGLRVEGPCPVMIPAGCILSCRSDGRRLHITYDDMDGRGRCRIVLRLTSMPAAAASVAILGAGSRP